MGCLTGFYLITSTEDEIGPRDVEGLVRDAFRHQARYRGKVPGATAANCGNYLLHDLPMARLEAEAFLSKKWKFSYPKTKRPTVRGKAFFDS
jgi:S-ribosylhomocysteine lyase